MSLAVDLLDQAKRLARQEPRRPKQASLRRSVSTAYYAFFHLLVDDAVKRLVAGGDREALRRCLGRAFAHGTMKKVASQFAAGHDGVSPRLRPGLNGEQLQDALVRLAGTFVDLQQARHEADYDLVRRFGRVEVLDLLDEVERAFTDWSRVRGSVQADVFLVGLLSFEQIKV